MILYEIFSRVMKKILYIVVSTVYSVFAVACSDAGNEPIDNNTFDVCDSLGDPVYRDSLVILQQPYVGTEHVICNAKVFLLHYTSYIAVYSNARREIQKAFPPGIYDVKGDSLLIVEDEWVSIYNLKSEETKRIIYGYHRPTFSMDDNCIHVRNSIGTYKYDMSSNRLTDTIPSMYARELRRGIYLYYSSGIVLYNSEERRETALSISGLPVIGNVLSMDYYDIDEGSQMMAIHLRGLSVPGGSALYEVDLIARTATVIACETDGLYTPRYGENGSVYITRTCEPSRESYVLEIDKKHYKETVVFEARMSKDGSVEYFIP